MEMHQVRYFLAVAQTLNFTRAAEQCNVSQPALTRAIQQLEQELSGPLLHREGRLTHLTELGTRMVPLMRQCYESALSAKSMASAYRKGTSTSLSLAISDSMNIQLLVDPLSELSRAFPGLQLRITRGDLEMIVDRLKRGEIDFAVGGALAERWDRLDSWALFEEGYALTLSPEHRLSSRNRLDLGQIAVEPMIVNSSCDLGDAISQFLAENGATPPTICRVSSQSDVIALLEANAGVGVLPHSASYKRRLCRVFVEKLMLRRHVFAYGVAGRPRSVAAEGMLKLLRSCDWSRYAQ